VCPYEHESKLRSGQIGMQPELRTAPELSQAWLGLRALHVPDKLSFVAMQLFNSIDSLHSCYLVGRSPCPARET
jgi:hypothetical protein